MRQLLSLAWPIVVSRSSQVVIGVADALMVAGLGEEALAATTAGAMNTFTVLILPMGIVFIVSSFASQFFGQGDLRAARRYGFYGLGVAALTQILALISIPFLNPVLRLFEYAPGVRELMHGYLEIRLLSGGAAIALEALANYYGGLGNTRLPMAANVLAMVLNVLGNWLLIFGHAGFPALGVTGAALASAVSTGLAAAFLLFCFWKGWGTRHSPRGLVPLEGAEFVRMLRFGVPSGLNWFFEFLAFSFFINVVVTGLGTTALAALMVVIQLNSISFMPAFGVASAAAILVGQAIGKKQQNEVGGILRLGLMVAGTWQGLVGVFYMVAPRVALAPFVNDSTTVEFQVIGVRMLMISAAWQLFDATVSVFAETLRAAGDTAFTLWARLLLAWLVFAPGAYIHVRFFEGGDVAAMGWLIVYLGFLALVLWLRFRKGTWRTIDLTGPMSQPAGV